MEAVEAYKLFIALKNHFSKPKYDYFLYNGKTRASKTSFETRKDKYMYHKLAKKDDPVNFIVANFVKYGYNIWVGDLVAESKYTDTYLEWKRRNESISYIFEQDLDKLLPSFDDSIKVIDGQYPKLLKLFLQNKINIETLIILDKACGIFRYWDSKLDGDLVWEEVRLKCKKYAPFVPYDIFKMKKIILKVFA